MLFAAAWAPMITSFATFWQYLQSILSYVIPPVAAIFLLGIFWRRTNENGALLALLVAVPLGAIGWIVVEILQCSPSSTSMSPPSSSSSAAHSWRWEAC